MKLSIALIAVLSLAAQSFACDMCRDAKPISPSAIPSKDAQVEAGLGFNSSIYFMLGSLGAAGLLTGRTMWKSVHEDAKHS